MLRERIPNRPLPDFFDSGDKKEYSKGERMYEEDSPVETKKVYGVLEGLVSLEREHPDRNKKFTTFVARPGDAFGMEDLPEGYHSSTAEALTSSIVVERELSDTDQTEPWVAQLVARRVRDAIEKGEFLAESNDVKAVAFALSELALPVTDDGVTEAVIPLSHPVIGRVIGYSREAVGKKLRRFQEKGLVSQQDKAQIAVHDLPGLLAETGLYRPKPKTRRERRQQQS